MVDSPEELVGKKNMYFKVNVKRAIALPKNLNCNAFVTYNFKFEKNALYTTEEM